MGPDSDSSSNGFPSELLSRIRLGMRAEEVDIVLGEVVEGCFYQRGAALKRVGVLYHELHPRVVELR